MGLYRNLVFCFVKVIGQRIKRTYHICLQIIFFTNDFYEEYEKNILHNKTTTQFCQWIKLAILIKKIYEWQVMI